MATDPLVGDLESSIRLSPFRIRETVKSPHNIRRLVIPEMDDSGDLETSPRNIRRGLRRKPGYDDSSSRTDFSAVTTSTRSTSSLRSDFSASNLKSFRTNLIDHSQRCSASVLKGAVDLMQKNNAIEAPKEQSWTTDVDGRTVTFALMNKVNGPPKISRSQRVPMRNVNKNVRHSISSRKQRVMHRIQRWLTQRDLPTLTMLHLAAFLALNTIYASIWYLEDGGCCSDHDMSFAQTFDFAVQTSSTIGYGTYHPEGYFNNGLVVFLISASICLHTVYGGLLFYKFITPTANIQFSEVITMSNVLGHACLEIRVGNADGDSNHLINAEANLCIT